MKKNLLIIALYFCAFQTYAQTTYYWVGATNGIWTEPTNWNTATDKSGSSRTSNNTADVLIFDGSVIGTGTMTITGAIRETVGAVKIVNGANLLLGQPAAYTELIDGITSVDYGASTLSVTGTSGSFSNLQVGDVISTWNAAGNTAAGLNPFPQGVVLAIKDANTITISKEAKFDAFLSNSATTTNINAGKYYVVTTLHVGSLDIDATSTLFLNTVTGGNFLPFAIAAKGGSIFGKVTVNSRGGGWKLIGTTRNDGDPNKGLRFKNGSTYLSNYPNTNGKQNYTLGANIGEYDGSGKFIIRGASGTNNQIPGYKGAAGIVFESGSTYSNLGTGTSNGEVYSPFGPIISANGTDLVFTPATSFETGSNYISTRVGGAYFYHNINASYPNLTFLDVPLTGTTNLTLGKVENLIFSGTTAAVAASTGTIIATGNITNSTANSINLGNVILAGTSAQTITEATGDFVFGDLTIADKAIVTLGSNINATNVNHLGALNFGANTITGTGYYYAFGSYTHATTASDFTIGSSSITGVDNIGAGTLSYYYPVGASVSNATYIPSGTIYRAFPSPAGTLSTFAKASGTGQIATFSNTGYTYTKSSSGSINASVPGFTSIILDINGATVLPIDNITLTGKLVNNEVALNWRTENEVEVNYFSVEKRNEGDADFKEIGKVNAKNKEVGFYYFNDRSNLSATNSYYRLKIIDNNGKYKYSDIVAVKLGLDNSNIELKAYPNPTTSKLDLLLPLEHAIAEITIISMEGKILHQQTAAINASKATIDVSQLVNGIYFVIYKDSSVKKTLKFVKN